MISAVPLAPRDFRDYGGIVPRPLFEEVVGLADGLRGRRILHINSTAVGGGVAALLRSEIPFMTGLGIDAEWRVLKPPGQFFEVTKRIHHALQGSPNGLRAADWRLYEDINREAAAALEGERWDLVVVHDPQPAAIRSFVGGPRPGRWFWRCHIDASRPHPATVRRLVRYLAPYDAAVFTLPEYCFEACRPKSSTIQPGIDALDPKNTFLEPEHARRVVEQFGLDADRPVVTQVARFDRWKNPLAAVQAWRLASELVPGLQLALIGEKADDDPDGVGILGGVRTAIHGRADAHVLANVADDHAVNAFQVASLAALQLSSREGFGLTVSEALWSGTPVIGAPVGGIPTQVDDGRSGYLVRTPKEAARRIVELARDPERSAQMGAAGRERVRRDFLLPRMMRDDLRVWTRLLDAR